MKEILNGRNRTIAGLLVGALALGGCGGAKGSSNQETTSETTPTSPAVPPSVNGNLNGVRFIKVSASKKGETFTLKPTTARTENLGVVYIPSISSNLLLAAGDTNPDDEAVTLVTEQDKKAYFSIAIFDHVTGEIERGGKETPTPITVNSREGLYEFEEGPRGDWYKLSLEALTNGEVQVFSDPISLNHSVPSQAS